MTVVYMVRAIKEVTAGESRRGNTKLMMIWCELKFIFDANVTTLSRQRGGEEF